MEKRLHEKCVGNIQKFSQMGKLGDPPSPTRSCFSSVTGATVSVLLRLAFVV
jgi:hypothetical protein